MGEDLVIVDCFFGHVEPDIRYIQDGYDSVVCESRSRRFDRNGNLVETTEWEPLSRMKNIPSHMMREIVSIPFDPSWLRRCFDGVLNAICHHGQ